jgi:hypothetical protein
MERVRELARAWPGPARLAFGGPCHRRVAMAWPGMPSALSPRLGAASARGVASSSAT